MWGKGAVLFPCKPCGLFVKQRVYVFGLLEKENEKCESSTAVLWRFWKVRVGYLVSSFSCL